MESVRRRRLVEDMERTRLCKIGTFSEASVKANIPFNFILRDCERILWNFHESSSISVGMDSNLVGQLNVFEFFMFIYFE